MNTIVSAVDARRTLGELLNRVMIANDEIVIERAGKKVAKLVRCDTKTDHQQQSEGKLDIRNSAGLGKELWNALDVDDYIRQERDSWN